MPRAFAISQRVKIETFTTPRSTLPKKLLSIRLTSASFSYGYGVPVNNAEAKKWHLEAAKQGCGMSQYMLGRIYHYGTGTPKSENDAVYWYRKAAEQGVVQAQFQLGKCLCESEDDEIRNQAEAEKLLRN